ncbi:hypothetical protein EDB85DRAFT_1894217 [Lactarius pseudohatsudake]|nr:hypothetical protein EDB85DRAFT_1894217 [Lactarius pseudohatsudake]
MASYCPELRFVRMLVEYGAEVNAKDKRGRTPLYRVLGNRYNSDEDRSGVAQLLLEHGADANTPDNYLETPLHLASRLVSLDLAWILLKNDADLNVEDIKGKIPFGLARERMREEMERPPFEYSIRRAQRVQGVALMGLLYADAIRLKKIAALTVQAKAKSLSEKPSSIVLRGWSCQWRDCSSKRSHATTAAPYFSARQALRLLFAARLVASLHYANCNEESPHTLMFKVFAEIDNEVVRRARRRMNRSSEARPRCQKDEDESGSHDFKALASITTHGIQASGEGEAEETAVTGEGCLACEGEVGVKAVASASREEAGGGVGKEVAVAGGANGGDGGEKGTMMEGGNAGRETKRGKSPGKLVTAGKNEEEDRGKDEDGGEVQAGRDEEREEGGEGQDHPSHARTKATVWRPGESDEDSSREWGERRGEDSSTAPHAVEKMRESDEKGDVDKRIGWYTDQFGAHVAAACGLDND